MNTKIYYKGLLFIIPITIINILLVIIFKDYFIKNSSTTKLLIILNWFIEYGIFNIFTDLSILTKDYNYF